MCRVRALAPNRAGMTMLEVTIATVFFALVMSFLVYLSLFVGKNTHIITRESRAETTNRNAGELIRHYLRMARAGSSNISVSNDKRTITFINPSLGSGVTSRIQYEHSPMLLKYYENINEDPYRTMRGVSNVAFDVYDFGSIVEVTLNTDTTVFGGDRIISVSQKFAVRPRN